MLSKIVEQIKKDYPVGTIVVLEKMLGESQMPTGMAGKVFHVDDAAQIHVSWENGSSLALIIGADSFRAITPNELNIVKQVISQYYMREFEEECDEELFDSIEKLRLIPVAYSTIDTSDGLTHDIQVCVDIINNRINKYLDKDELTIDDKPDEVIQFPNLKSLVEELIFSSFDHYIHLEEKTNNNSPKKNIPQNTSLAEKQVLNTNPSIKKETLTNNIEKTYIVLEGCCQVPVTSKNLYDGISFCEQDIVYWNHECVFDNPAVAYANFKQNKTSVKKVTNPNILTDFWHIIEYALVEIKTEVSSDGNKSLVETNFLEFSHYDWKNIK